MPGFSVRVLRALADAWDYVMFGEMLRPPAIDVPTITASYCKFMYDGKVHQVDPSQRHEVRDSAVQCGAWRGPDGSIGALFANISREPVEFEVELSAYGLEAPGYDVAQVVQGEATPLLSGVSLPRCQCISMEPLSVVLLTVRRPMPFRAGGAVQA